LKKKGVLIDCDPGIDDALAILFALASNKLDIKAITTVYGNVGVRQSTRNLITILEISGLGVVPEIGIGSNGPLVKKRPKKRYVHGRDGLGDTLRGRPGKIARLEDAVRLAAAKILSKEIEYIIATGPLTNVAKIIRSKPKIPDLIKRIYIMGGAFFVKGNVTPYAEFNIYNDPEAAKIVFDSHIPKTVIGLDVTQKVILERKDLIGFEKGRGRLSGCIYDIANFAVSYHREFRGARGAYMNDPLCVGAAIDSTICKYKKGLLDIKLNGAQRGRIVAGAKGALPRDTMYAYSVNAERFKKLFLKSLTKMCKEVQVEAGRYL